MFLPRALFHAGLACFDAPIMTLWFATVYAYWRCLDGRRWPWQVGVLFGLALATKHNALLLPFALGAALRDRRRTARAAGAASCCHRWRVLVSLAVLGPLTLIALWPWLWFDTVAHVRDWLAFHTDARALQLRVPRRTTGTRRGSRGTSRSSRRCSRCRS